MAVSTGIHFDIAAICGNGDFGDVINAVISFSDDRGKAVIAVH